MIGDNEIQDDVFGTMTAQDGLELRKSEFREWEDITYDGRIKCQRDHDYYDGNQYTPKQLTDFAARGQPAICFNRIASRHGRGQAGYRRLGR